MPSLFIQTLMVAMVAMLAGACNEKGFEIGKDVESPTPRFETEIKLPPGLGTVKTSITNARGETVGVKCSTCHSMELGGEVPARKAEELKDFHKDMKFNHGTLDCQSCHHPDDRDSLRLANGDSLAFADTMQLCAQCHGSQMRDYNDGLHGGMNGYWDLSKGPRVRNSCMHCHDVHNPAFPIASPVFAPRDRFLSPAEEPHHE